MKYDPQKHRRRSIRLKGYDYSLPGYYFVTVCVKHGLCELGQVRNGRMSLNQQGKIAADCWQWLAKQYPYVILDAYVIMPNHLHGIIILEPDDVIRGRGKGGSRTAPTATSQLTEKSLEPPKLPKRKPLGSLVGAFKTTSTKKINELRDAQGMRFWQRNYYEHIIRNERALSAIRHYVQNNPEKWTDDQLHPDAPLNKFNAR